MAEVVKSDNDHEPADTISKLIRHFDALSIQRLGLFYERRQGGDLYENLEQDPVLEAILYGSLFVVETRVHTRRDKAMPGSEAIASYLEILTPKLLDGKAGERHLRYGHPVRQLLEKMHTIRVTRDGSPLDKRTLGPYLSARVALGDVKLAFDPAIEGDLLAL